MNNLTNTLQNKALSALGHAAGHGITSAIKGAAAKTGVDFAYLMQQARAESSFNPTAKAKTSSASGLYQFIESTWMNMVDKHGDKHGIKTDGLSRKNILAMRNDPHKASAMAAELAADNKQFLQTHHDGKIGATELYFAHFLGAGSAASFLNARAENGMNNAATLFPAAAKANKSIFYDKTSGRAKSLDEIYNHFDKKFKIEGAAQPQDTQIAHASIKADSQHSASSENLEPTRAHRRSSFTNTGFHTNLLTNPMEMMLISQMLELPISRKNGEFDLFSTRKAYSSSFYSSHS